MKEKLRQIIEKSPVDYLEIRLEEHVTQSLSFLGKELEDIGEKESQGGCVRACQKGGWGFSSFNLFGDLDRAVSEAVDQAKCIGKEETRLKSAPPVTGDFVQALGKDPRAIDLEQKRDIAQKYNSIILSDPKIVSSRVSYADHTSFSRFVSSNGSNITQKKTFTGITFSAIARDGMNVQRAYHSAGDLRGFDNVLGLEEKAEEVKKRAIDLLSAKKIEGGRYTVIMDPKLTGVFAHEAFGHMSESDFIFDNPRIADKMKIGSQFGPEFLNIIDDGTLLTDCGGYGYDDEGVPSQKTYLIRQGKLAAHLHSMETAEKMGEPLTGNARAINFHYKPIVRMSCTYIEKGEAPFEQMIGDIKDGIYAKGMLGGNTDLEQFTFSAENAFQIKDGRVDALLRDVILTGNLFETLHNIDMVGNDLRLYGGMGGCGKEGQSPLPVSDGGPHIRVKNVLIG